MLETLLIGSIVFTLYAYFGYPLSLYLIGQIRHRDLRKNPIYPDVTIIITAYNEEKTIRQKLGNTLGLEYPKGRLQIIVASDGSEDQTNKIVREYKEQGIVLIEIKERRGKENAQKEAIKQSKGDILVFTDVATRLNSESLKQIVFSFADPSVGCVSSEDRLIGKDGKPSGEGFYVRYEMWLRRLESKVNSLVGLSGSFFAARRVVCQDFSEEMASDFRTVLNCVKMGFRGISDPLAIGYYQDVSVEKQEFNRKIRTVVRGLTVFFYHLEFLNFLRYGLFSYQYVCHKLLRWLVPFFLCIAFITNLFLAARSIIFLLLFLGQLSFYGLAIWQWKNGIPSSRTVIKMPLYFLTVNVSILVAWWRYLQGKRVIMWTPSER